MEYEEARAYLRKVELSLGWVLGLDSMRELLSRLDNPQDKLKFVHIAGTNGKGSVLAFISGILQEAGYRVGRYSSPRVFAYEEFVQINGENISKEAFCRHTAQVMEACEGMLAEGFAQPTLFEVETAVGLLHFVENKCDIVTLECGLGGRDDATNVITTAVCCAFSAIGLDHMEFLGNTVYEIAQNKAGIIKKGIPAVLGIQPPQASQVRDNARTQETAQTQEPSQVQEAVRAVRERCAEMGSSLTEVDQGSLCVHEGLAVWNGKQYLEFDYKDYENVRIPLLGRYQAENASLAIEVMEVLGRAGYPFHRGAIYRGLEKAVWHGRFEILCTEPTVVLDGAHNPPAAKRLRESIDYYFAGKRILFVMGVLADKDYDTVTGLTCPAAEEVFTLTPENPRALGAKALAETIRRHGVKATAASSYGEAVRMALEAAGKEDVVIIFGSLSFLHDLARIVLGLKAKP